MATELRTERVEALLESVLDLSPAEQQAVLDRHRPAEPKVCAQVEELLAGAWPAFLDCLAAVPPVEEWFGPEASTVVAPGTCLEDYAIEAEIGRGGMAVVYRARQISLDRVVAIKMLPPGPRASPAVVKRFRAEAEAVARLQHPNVVQIYAVGDHEGLPFLALEYVAGGPLSARLADGPLPPRRAAQLAATLAAAVHHAHQRGIVHLDLKPANVLLEKGNSPPPRHKEHQEESFISSWCSLCLGGELTPKVTDFGLARKWAAGVAATVPSGAAWGTPSYMAPEQADAGRRHEVGPYSDTYALGAILYELLTGRPPFQADTPLEVLDQVRSQEPLPLRRLRPDVPRDLETVCLKCLAKEPARRYASAEKLAEDLKRWLAGEPVQARPVGPLGRIARWCGRRPAVAALLATVLLVVTAGSLTSLGLWLRAVHQEARALAGEAEALTHLRNEEAARRDAEANVRAAVQMITDSILVSDTALLQAPEVNPVAVELLLKAETRGARLLRDREQDYELRALLAETRIRLGRYYLKHGQPGEALAWFEKAAGLFDLLSPERVRHLGYLSYAIATNVWLGRGYALQGDRESARRAFASSFRLWQRLAKAAPNPTWTDEAVVQGLDLVQALQEAGDSESDIRGWFQRLRGRPELLGGAAQYDQFLDLLRVKLVCLGLGKARPGRLEAALAAARDVAAFLDRPTPDAVPRQSGRRWAALHAIELSIILRQGGATADALRLLESATRALQALVDAAPNDPDLLVKLGDVWEQAGKAHWELDRIDETLDAYRHALTAQRRVLTLAPAKAGHRRALGARLLKLARKYCELGRLDEAGALLRERQALWPGDTAKHAEVLAELRKWAAEAGRELSPEKRLEHQRYLDLCARLDATEVGSGFTAVKRSER